MSTFDIHPRRSRRLQARSNLQPRSNLIQLSFPPSFNSTTIYTASSHVYNIAECMYLVLDNCDWQSLVTMSHVDRRGRNRVRQIFRNRLSRVFQPFMSETDRNSFFELMRDTKAALVAGLPLEIMRPQLSSPKDPLKDFQLVIPWHTYQIWMSFMASIGYIYSGNWLNPISS